MRKNWIWMFLALMLIPAVSADVLLPFLSSLAVVNFVLLIPVILIEALFAYVIVKKFFKFQIKFGYSILMLLAANALSLLLGGIAAYFIYADSRALIIPAYVVTVLVEAPIIYFFLKKKDDKWIDSFKISLFVNTISYLILAIIILGFMSY